MDSVCDLLPDPSLALEFWSPIAVAFAAGGIRWAWLRRHLDRPGAVFRRVSFAGPAYALEEGVGWARLELHASPMLTVLALIGSFWLVDFGLWPALVGSSTRHAGAGVLVGLTLIGGVWALAGAACRQRLVLLIEPGVLVVEVRRLLRTRRREVIAPTRVAFDVVEGALWLQVEHQGGGTDPGLEEPLELEAFRLDGPRPVLIADLEVSSRAFTAVAAASRPTT